MKVSLTSYLGALWMLAIRDEMPLAWAICLMVSVILFAGAVIFKGRALADEFQRRFHL